MPFNICKNSPCCATYRGNYEEITAYFSVEKIPFEIIKGIKNNSRLRSKLAVRGTSDKPLIGLFYPGTHDVFEVSHCLLHHEKINQAIHLIKNWISENELIPYSENGHSGDIRYIQCVVERATSSIQISFAIKDESIAFKKALPSLIKACPPEFLHSIWINYNPLPGNTIFGSKWEHCFGKQWLVEKIAGVHACYLPGSFGQANLSMFEQLIGSIKNHIEPNKKVAEFYAGIGVIGLAIAPVAEQLILTEVNSESKICFDEMERYLPSEIAQKTSYILSKAEHTLKLLDEVDIAIVDPPRKGLDRSFINTLKYSSVNSLIYVSCGWPSLMRDLNLLKAQGWKVEKAEGYPFFPGTPHLETLCFLTR